LRELSHAAAPKVIQAWIQDRFGIEMSLDHITTAKEDILRIAAKEKSDAESLTGRKRNVTTRHPFRWSGCKRGKDSQGY